MLSERACARWPDLPATPRIGLRLRIGFTMVPHNEPPDEAFRRIGGKCLNRYRVSSLSSYGNRSRRRTLTDTAPAVRTVQGTAVRCKSPVQRHISLPVSLVARASLW